MRRILLSAIGALFLLFSFQSPLLSTIYGSISGKVIAEDTGKGVKGAWVYLYFYYEKAKRFGDAPASVETDEKGRFEFKNLQPGRYCITVEGPPPYYGDNDYLWMKLSRGDAEGADCLILRSGERIINFKKIVKVGGSISGRVLKGDGSPLANFPIWVSSNKGTTRRIDTGADGSYVAGGLKPSDDYSISTPSFKYKDAWIPEKWIEGVLVKEKEETKVKDIIIDVNDPTGVEGVVKLADGTPLENVVIGLDKNGRAVLTWCVSDKDGRYKIINIEPGVYKVLAGFKDKDILKENVIVEKGKTTKVDFIFENILKKNLIHNQCLNQCLQSLSIQEQSYGDYFYWEWIEGKLVKYGKECNNLPIEERRRIRDKAALALHTVSELVKIGGCNSWKTEERKCIPPALRNGFNGKV